MLMKEFIQRTGFEPTEDEYEEIEKAYYEYDGGKDRFCADFVKNGGIEEICKKRISKIVHLEEQLVKANEEIRVLKGQLEKELEWKPSSSTGTNLSQADYEELANMSNVVRMTEQDAKKMIYEEFGFSSEKIMIVDTVSTYEVNRHHRVRENAKFKREPLYFSTDWNYIRFDCVGLKYEVVNGDLREYND